MVNDIPSCLVGNVRSLQYADDLKLYVAIASTCDERNLQQTIDNLTKWSNENEIGINSAKTHFMKYLPRVNSVSDYFIGVKKIEEVSTIKDLGVYFDQELTFKPHMNHVSIKIKQMTAEGFRFSREIYHPPILAKIATTYILIHIAGSGILFKRVVAKSHNGRKGD